MTSQPTTNAARPTCPATGRAVQAGSVARRAAPLDPGRVDSVAPGAAVATDVPSAGGAAGMVHAPCRPSRTAPRTLADAVRSAVARGRLEAAVAAFEELLASLEQRSGGRLADLGPSHLALAWEAFGRAALSLHAVCGRDGGLPADERQSLGAAFGERLQRGLLTLAGRRIR